MKSSSRMKNMQIRSIKFPVFLIGLVLFFSCEKGLNQPDQSGYEIPVGFPEMPDPEGNEYTDLRWKLGQKLFFDSRLSKDNQVSCASCHKPELAFADNRAASPGAFDRPGVKNSPSLANVGYHPYFMREGGVPTLEMQILVPIQEHNEFAHNIVDICDSLRDDPVYSAWSSEAYARSFDPFVLTRALAMFERSLISGASRYDVFNNGGSGALTSIELEGRALFFSERTNCSTCHSGFLFTDFDFKNNGLDTVDSDIGRERLTSNPLDRYTYKTPSLRNVAITGPYMHKGQLTSLDEVIDHYNSGGVTSKYKDSMIRPMGLTPREKDALVAFLGSLTDEKFISREWTGIE